MEPAAAKIIWSRSVERRKLCFTTFIGDGDSTSYQLVSGIKLYNGAPIRKEECLAHVSKRLKFALRRIMKNTRNKSYVQLHLVEPKAEYISSNYSTVVRQHRGQSPTDIYNALCIFFSHVIVYIHTPLKTLGADGDKHLTHLQLRIRTTHRLIFRSFQHLCHREFL